MVIDALRDGFGISTDKPLNTEEWAMLTEVPLRVFKDPAKAPLWRNIEERTIDVLFVRCWKSGTGFERVAIEVKVSRADFRHETDVKRAPAEATAHRCVYAAPVGVIPADELPAGWGLIEVYPDREAWRAGTGHPFGAYNSLSKWRVKAKRRTPTCDLDYLVAAVARKGSRLAEQLRRGESDAAEVVTLRAALTAAEDALQRAVTARDREMTRAKAARSELLALEGAQECADCGGRITWKRGGHHDSTWVHADLEAERVCYAIRVENNRRARMATTGAHYLSGYPEPITPKVARDREREQTA